MVALSSGELMTSTIQSHKIKKTHASLEKLLKSLFLCKTLTLNVGSEFVFYNNEKIL